MVIPASLLFFGLGTALYVFYEARPEALPVAEQKDIIVPWFIATQLPAGFAGLVIAGLFAATMSSVDSGMHSIATTLTNDVYNKLRPGCADEKRLRVARYLTVLAGLCGTLAAVFLTFSGLDGGSLWILLLQVVIPIGSALTGVFLLGVLTTGAHSRGAAVGVIASMAIVILFANMENSPLPHPVLKAAVGVLTCVVVGYLVSLAIPGPGRSLTDLTLHTVTHEDATGKKEETNE